MPCFHDNDNYTQISISSYHPYVRERNVPSAVVRGNNTCPCISGQNGAPCVSGNNAPSLFFSRHLPSCLASCPVPLSQRYHG